MKLINLMDADNFIEDIMFAKADIEEKRINEGKIDKKQNMEEFVGSLPLGENVYIYGDISIPFGFIEGVKDRYLFYTNDLKKEEDFNQFISDLSSIKFNMSNLRRVNYVDIIDEENQIPFYVINGNVYAK